MIPARIEQATFCVLSRRDNHYTTEPLLVYMVKDIFILCAFYFSKSIKAKNKDTNAHLGWFHIS